MKKVWFVHMSDETPARDAGEVVTVLRNLADTIESNDQFEVFVFVIRADGLFDLVGYPDFEVWDQEMRNRKQLYEHIQTGQSIQ